MWSNSLANYRDGALLFLRLALGSLLHSGCTAGRNSPADSPLETTRPCAMKHLRHHLLARLLGLPRRVRRNASACMPAHPRSLLSAPSCLLLSAHHDRRRSATTRCASASAKPAHAIELALFFLGPPFHRPRPITASTKADRIFGAKQNFPCRSSVRRLTLPLFTNRGVEQPGSSSGS